jgi:hypothetical protein
MTAGGRLLIDTATGGVGTNTRFGAGNDSSDTVLISYGTSGVNRVVNLGAGGISATLNDGSSTPATFQIQNNGGDTSIGTLGSSGGSGVYLGQSAIDRRMVISSGSGIDVVLNSTGATGQPLTINGSGGSVFFGASGTTNQAFSWSGGSGLDRRMQIGGNSIQVSLNSNGTSYQNLAIQTGGGNALVGSGSAGAGLQVSSSGTVMSKVRHGTFVLSSGAATISDSNVTSSTRIFLTSQVDGGTPGWLRVSSRSVGVSFTVTSSSGSDTSTVGYVMIEP